MADFENHVQELGDAGIKVIAASVDPEDKAQEVAADLSYPVAFGVTRDEANLLDTWWEDRRQIIQPSEFLLKQDGTVMTSSYSSGPLGRILASDVVKMVKFVEAQAAKG